MRKEGFIKGDKVIITKEWRPEDTIIRLDRTGKEATFVEYTDNQPKGYQYEVKIEGITCLVWDIDKLKTTESEEQINQVKINLVDKQPSINLDSFNEQANLIFNTIVQPQIKKYMEEIDLERNELVSTQDELIEVLKNQVIDLSMMSKIELGDDVIHEIIRLEDKINQIKNQKYKIVNNNQY